MLDVKSRACSRAKCFLRNKLFHRIRYMSEKQKKKDKLKIDLKLAGTPRQGEEADHGGLVNKMSEMSIPESLKLDLKAENLVTLKELGAGS